MEGSWPRSARRCGWRRTAFGDSRLRKPHEERGAPIPIDLESVTEARLVAQALAGSQPAFEQILRRYQRPILAFLARMTGDASLAEELAQDTFVKAFRNLAAFDTTRRLSSWLFRIAHNTGIDALRKGRPPVVPLEDREGDL